MEIDPLMQWHLAGIGPVACSGVGKIVYVTHDYSMKPSTPKPNMSKHVYAMTINRISAQCYTQHCACYRHSMQMLQ